MIIFQGTVPNSPLLRSGQEGQKPFPYLMVPRLSTGLPGWEEEGGSRRCSPPTPTPTPQLFPGKEGGQV